jgi:hypothetical protein
MLMSTKCQENEKKMTTNVIMIGYDMIFMIFFNSCFPSGSNLLRTVLRRTVHWFVPLGTLNLPVEFTPTLYTCVLCCTLSLVSSESDSRRIFDIS